MPTIRSLIRTSFLSLSIAVMTLALPVATFADGSTAPACVAPTASEPGNRTPSGAAESTYHYNCSTGLWENDHYTFNPNTQVYTATDPVVYTYNSATGVYDYKTWKYSPAQGAYYQAPFSTATPPSGSNVVGGPEPVVPNTSQPPAKGTENRLSDPATSTATSTGIGGGGPGSTSTSDLTGTANTRINNNTSASLNNTIIGNASSGNSLILGNTSGGNAATGNAQDVANIINLLQSSSNAIGVGGNLLTFVANIDGDVNGDLLLDPASLGSIQPAAVNTATNLASTTTINNSLDASINNDINLASRSGDADVTKNTSAGNATTGNATTIANLVNTINSVINSGQSFLGVVNINGNLNGDILLPPDFIDQLIASNVPTVTISAPNSVVENNTSIANTTNVNNTNDLGINNNISSTAASGQATVNGNTRAGNATTGNATTNVTAFNLTGSNVVGANNLLVFVNVLGKWVGLIVNAPAGATAAQLGGGITTNTTNVTNDTDINNTTKESINNNVNVAANSGDATIAKNTTAGNATTGDAKTAVNLLNIENSNLSFSNWFGILFINVFGTWNGDFGRNTSAGDPILPPAFANGFPIRATASDKGVSSDNAPRVFRFVARTDDNKAKTNQAQRFDAVPVGSSSVPEDVQDAAVLSASSSNDNGGGSSNAAGSSQNSNSFWNIARLIGSGLILYLLADSIITSLNARRLRSRGGHHHVTS